MSDGYWARSCSDPDIFHNFLSQYGFSAWYDKVVDLWSCVVYYREDRLIHIDDGEFDNDEPDSSVLTEYAESASTLNNAQLDPTILKLLRYDQFCIHYCTSW